MIQDTANDFHITITMLELEFYGDHCKQCISSGKQEVRGCSLPRGNDFRWCGKKDRYLEKKLKEKKKKIMGELISQLLLEHSQGFQDTSERRFTEDIFP